MTIPMSGFFVRPIKTYVKFAALAGVLYGSRTNALHLQIAFHCSACILPHIHHPYHPQTTRPGVRLRYMLTVGTFISHSVVYVRGDWSQSLDSLVPGGSVCVCVARGPRSWGGGGSGAQCFCGVCTRIVYIDAKEHSVVDRLSTNAPGRLCRAAVCFGEADIRHAPTLLQLLCVAVTPPIYHEHNSLRTVTNTKNSHLRVLCAVAAIDAAAATAAAAVIYA